MTIHLHNQITGAVQEAPTGFSWSCLFLGGLIPIMRGDWGAFFKLCGLSLITFGIYHFIFCASYNKEYMKTLIMQGYTPANEQAEQFLRLNGIYVAPKS